MKTRMMALVALTFGLAALTTACGGNDCEDAADRILAKYEECGVSTTDGSSSDGGDAECSEEAGALAQCYAGCTEAASCETLKGEDAEGAVTYGECVAGC